MSLKKDDKYDYDLYIQPQGVRHHIRSIIALDLGLLRKCIRLVWKISCRKYQVFLIVYKSFGVKAWRLYNMIWDTV